MDTRINPDPKENPSSRSDRGKPQSRFPYKPKVIHPTLHKQRITALIKRSVKSEKK